jgi:hypothetical protein
VIPTADILSLNDIKINFRVYNSQGHYLIENDFNVKNVVEEDQKYRKRLIIEQCPQHEPMDIDEND